MAVTSFDLRERGWIPVVSESGEVTEVGLRELFARSREFSSIASENAFVDTALYRLAIAVMGRALTRDGRIGASDPVDDWLAIHGSPQLVADAVSRYLDDFGDRFDLLSDTAPFMQVAGLEPRPTWAMSNSSVLAVLGGGSTLSGDVPPDAASRMPFPLAARMVVATQAGDPVGIHSLAANETRDASGGWGVKAGRFYGTNMKPGHLGRIEGCMFLGSTLFDTLCLNLVLGSDGTGYFEDFEHDVPIWERDPLGPAYSPVTVSGMFDLMTNQSRRIRLFDDGDAVIGAFVTYQNAVPDADGERYEVMGTFSANKEGALLPRGHKAYDVLGADVFRRIMEGVLRWSADEVTAESHPPRVVGWYEALLGAGAVDEDAMRPRVAMSGLLYDDKSAVVQGIVSDGVEIDPRFIADEDLRDLAQALYTKVCEVSGKVIKFGLGYGIARMHGAKPGSPQEKKVGADVQREFHANLVAVCREFLSNPSDDPCAAEMAAYADLREEAHAAIDAKLANPGAVDIIGRAVAEGGSVRWYSAGQVKGRAVGMLNKAIPRENVAGGKEEVIA